MEIPGSIPLQVLINVFKLIPVIFFMKLSDLFVSEDKLEVAKATIGMVSAKKKPSAADVQKMDEAKELIARARSVRRLVMAAAFAGAAGLVGYGVYSGSRAEEKSTTVASAGNSASLETSPGRFRGPASAPAKGADLEANKIEKLDKVIVEVESSLNNLQKEVSGKLAKLPDAAEREKLEEAFKLAEINKENPNKNYLRLLEAQRTNNSGIFRQDNINYFSYDIDNSEMAATYLAPMRKVQIRADFDKDNLLDALVLYHEFQHVMHDTLVRSRLDSKEKFEAYLGAYTAKRGKMVVPIIGEGTAYAHEIEMLDLLLDGALKSNVPVDPVVVQKKLKATPQQMGTVKLLIALAGQYYGSGSSLKRGLRHSYLDKIASYYDASRYQILWQDSPYL